MFKKLIIGTALTLVVIASAIYIIGGGFGNKPPLPTALQYANRPMLIGHRGATSTNPLLPDNTLAAFSHAQERGYRWIEFDIQNSADGAFVVYHDRIGGEELPDVDTVSHLTLAQLQTHKIVSGSVLTDYTIPTLDSVIRRFDTTMFYYFDMKTYGSASIFSLADNIARFINEHGLVDNVFVATHRVAFIAYLEYRHPEVNTVLEGFNERMAELLDYVPKNFKPDMISGYQVALDDSLVSFLRESGWIERYITFHVDSANLKQTLDWGIQYIMVDDGKYVDSLLKLQTQP